jgi:hypothetical protein
VNLVSGGLIQIEDYNEIALEVNRLFSDNTVNLNWATSNRVLDYTVAGTALGSGSPIPFDNLGLNLNSGSFLVVVVDQGDGFFTLKPNEFNLNFTPNPEQISFTQTYGIGTRIQAYFRESHRYGWGQQASVYPVNVGDPVLADEAVLQAYLEANVNNLIDKVNIMEERTDGPSELTRVAQGQLIFATDKTTITNTINTDILSGANYWKNEVATVTTNVESITRNTEWTTELTGIMRWTWDSYDNLRYFFNSGCECRATLATSGDANNQGFINWTRVIDQMGSLILNYDTCLQTGTGGTSEGFGAYELTEEFQVVYRSAGNSAPVGVNPTEYLDEYDEYLSYRNLRIVWEARILPDTPAAGNMSIDIRARLDDREYAQSFNGTLEYQAGRKMGDGITDNSAVFSSADFVPVITAFQDWQVTGASPDPVTLLARYSDVGFANGQDVGQSFNIDVGDITVRYSIVPLGNSGVVTYDDDTATYIATSNFNSLGTLQVNGDGLGESVRIRMEFEPATGLALTSTVDNLSFRINGIDGATAQERVIVKAFNANNDQLNISYTLGSNLSESNNAITCNSTDGTPAQAAHSALIFINEPMARVEVTVECLNDAPHEIYLSDVAFTTVPI